MHIEDQIRDLLRACYDPAIPLNIVDLGLIQSLTLTPDPDAPGAGIPGVPQKLHLHLALIPNSEDEAAQSQLLAQIANALAGLPELSRPTLELRSTPIWTPARITPEGRALLGLDKPQFPILNNRVR